MIPPKKGADELVDLLKLIEEDKFSTKSIKGSSEEGYDDNERATVKSRKLSMLFESIHIGEMEHSRVERNLINRAHHAQPHQNIQNSEIYAIKTEIEKRVSRPLTLNIMIIGRKSAGKSSFIRMLLDYVGTTHPAFRGWPKGREEGLHPRHWRD